MEDDYDDNNDYDKMSDKNNDDDDDDKFPQNLNLTFLWKIPV